MVPKLEAPGYDPVPLSGLGVDMATWVDGEDPYALVASRVGNPAKVAVGDMMVALHVLGLRGALPDSEQVLAGPIVRELRMRKDAEEVAALRAAGAAIDRVHARMGEFLQVGRTESEVGADIAAAIVEEGHAVAEFVIVASGPNGASPHHSLSDKVVEDGPAADIELAARHPYTRLLRACVPGLHGPLGPLAAIEGAPPRLGRMPAGCPFAPRCPQATDTCEREMPALVTDGARRIACWRPQ